MTCTTFIFYHSGVGNINYTVQMSSNTIFKDKLRQPSMMFWNFDPQLTFPNEN